jgi:2-hydroxy-3-keto-5-methylthiopentenyl-1-phosphate phosphatase
MRAGITRHYLVACDFDQTLSLNDSGIVLSELIGVSGFQQKVTGLSDIHLVQQGAELAYLLRHDPEFRCVRRAHLVEAGKHVHVKKDIARLLELLADGVDGHRFSFRVISAAPQEIIQSALEGVVPPEHISGTEFDYDPSSDEICAIKKVPAGYGKVVVLGELEAQLQIRPDRIVYVGDGSSDVHVMLHVNNRDGFTVAVSETKHVTRIASRTVLGSTALSVLVPILEGVLGWGAVRIRELFESYGLVLQEWDRARTDWVTVGPFSVANAEVEERIF